MQNQLSSGASQFYRPPAQGNWKTNLCLYAWLMVTLLMARSGRFTIYVDLALVLVFCTCISANSLGTNAKRFWVSLIGLYIFGLLAYGLLRRNLVEDVVSDTIVFIGCIVIIIFPPFSTKRMLDQIPKVLEYCLCLGIPLFFVLYKYMGYQPGSSGTARFLYDEDARLQLYAPLILLQPAYILLFFERQITVRAVIIVVISLLLILYMGLITLSLHIFFSTAVAFTLYFLFISSWGKITGYMLAILGVSLAIGYYVVNSNQELLTSRQSLEQRAGGETGFAGRLDEQKTYFDEVSLTEVVFGKGLGGAKVPMEFYNAVPGAAMLHFGWAHLMMKGGLFLAALTYGAGLFSIFQLWRGPYHPYAVYMVFTLITEVVHTHWQTFCGAMLYCLVISFALARSQHPIRLGKPALSTVM